MEFVLNNIYLNVNKYNGPVSLCGYHLSYTVNHIETFTGWINYEIFGLANFLTIWVIHVININLL